MKWVSLHHHNTFSYQDGYGLPGQHADRAVELGMSALAITDHGNVSGHVAMEKACAKAGIKPIYGLEAYTQFDHSMDKQRKFHLTLLAMDREGYRNLMQLVTRSWAEGFKRWPTVSMSMLRDHHEGLIVLSGCSDSMLACSLLGGKTIPAESASYKRAKKLAAGFKRLLGDRYYLECQMFPELERSGHINQAYERLSRELGIPLVGTADVHYPRPEDRDMRVIIHAAGRGNATMKQQEESWDYSIPASPPESDRIALDRLLGTGLSKRAAQEAARNTAEIAERCNVTLPKAERFVYPASEKELDW